MSSKQKQEVLNNTITLLYSSTRVTVLQHCWYIALSPCYGASPFWHTLVSRIPSLFPLTLSPFLSWSITCFSHFPPSAFLSAAPPDFPLHFSPYMSVCFSADGLVFIAGKKKERKDTAAVVVG